MFGFLTNAINAVLLCLVAAAPLLSWPKTHARNAGPFWLRSFLGIGIGVALAEGGKRFAVWPGHSNFPSGHETVALAAGVCLAVRNPRWLALAAPLAAVQGWALVAGHFHRPADIAGALLTGLLPPLACHLYKPAPAS
jgi:membrane-associated phospholipid phosphatase